MPPAVPRLNAPSPSQIADLLRRAAAGLRTGVRTLAFWIAVVLPAAYLPVLIGPSLLSISTPTATHQSLALLGLLVLHGLCIVLGHEHSPRSRRGRCGPVAR
ncbi:hypothetical protein C482_18592 [Natrialba chahannaoensis JCM 10990]|uniref:Uncharacterized protein n=1 Tax=Natrialba chahannaoensis JCM 10990 TaxID=1227492 RepID=M0A6F3_9EURY|nr:hypothetical protein [Natrialba chahannaoensis]ELY94345.1 hypothetical protein C482_18592 [Natrialba chahannaoensis JCM 10990]